MRGAAGLAIAAVSLALAACDASEAADSADSAAPIVEAAPTVSTIDAMQLQTLLEDGGIRLVDVRTDEEVAGGVIPGAEHVVLDDFDPARLDLSDGREVVLYCRSGRRSEFAAQRLAEHTGKPARHLEGGITAWADAGHPIVQD
ncbi:rhodanese-like domain-containing protein [Altererythrobacter arenosus]|uniref:Rhodanese-like domain-containing protein n=1 Tax=Altererythrobacter arenosus TaxID=3032592 RepID=A0ABY8FM22_9SPHN|nr:rhodanese-like domain-containing protein [Altererythrobacter sp. CAU 1644]WFL76064.1 rhodanese-like domain-containing protein [Altererythrobacter sp. CAU 1644]